MSFGSFKARIAGENAGERRSDTRAPVELGATVRELGAEGVEARVLNVSSHGFMAVADGSFEVGARVWLILPGRARANAVVKWTVGDKLGAEFAEPVLVEAFRA